MPLDASPELRPRRALTPSILIERNRLKWGNQPPGGGGVRNRETSDSGTGFGRCGCSSRTGTSVSGRGPEGRIRLHVERRTESWPLLEGVVDVGTTK